MSATFIPPEEDAEALARRAIIHHEDLRLLVYDDATGKVVVPGYTMIGHPTIGYGRSLDIDGISTSEARYLLENSLGARLNRFAAVEWYRHLTPVRQAVILDLSYNVGIQGVFLFVKMIAAINRDDYAAAGNEILDSKVPTTRAKELARAMSSGLVQPWMR